MHIFQPTETANGLSKMGFNGEVAIVTEAGHSSRYHTRPGSYDPDSCVWEVYSLQRYVPGAQPIVEVRWNEGHADEAFWGNMLIQDYQNMKDEQKGLKSRVFRGALPHPLQEVAVSNSHQALVEFMDSGGY